MAEYPIKKAYSRAREKWPGLKITFERFKTYIEDKHREANEAKKIIKIEKMAVEDLYLAMALSDKAPLALELFHCEYRAYIRNVTVRAVGNNEHIEDILQQFELEIPGRIKKYRGTGSLYGWLGMVAPNFARDHLRKIRYTEPVKENIPAPDNDEYDIRECNELFREIFPRVMNGLKTDWQLIVRHKYSDGLTNRETAALLKTHESYISKLLNKKILPKMKKGLLNLSGDRDALLECLKLIGHLDFWEEQQPINKPRQ